MNVTLGTVPPSLMGVDHSLLTAGLNGKPSWALILIAVEVAIERTVVDLAVKAVQTSAEARKAKATFVNATMIMKIMNCSCIREK